MAHALVEDMIDRIWPSDAVANATLGPTNARGRLFFDRQELSGRTTFNAHSRPGPDDEHRIGQASCCFRQSGRFDSAAVPCDLIYG